MSEDRQLQDPLLDELDKLSKQSTRDLHPTLNWLYKAVKGKSLFENISIPFNSIRTIREIILQYPNEEIYVLDQILNDFRKNTFSISQRLFLLESIFSWIKSNRSPYINGMVAPIDNLLIPLANEISITTQQMQEAQNPLSDDSIPNKLNLKENVGITNVIILFSSQEDKHIFYSGIKGFFKDQEQLLLTLLDGEFIKERLIFHSRQSRFVELLTRMKYHGKILNDEHSLKEWITSNFSYEYKKGSISEIRLCNEATVHKLMSKRVGEPSRKERILEEWLAYRKKTSKD